MIKRAGNDINMYLFQFLDYKSLAKIQQVNINCLAVFINCIDKQDDFLLNSILNSEYVENRSRSIFKIRGKVKDPYKYITTHHGYYLYGPCIRRHNRDIDMIKTKIIYLKTPSIKTERLINFIHRFCNCSKFSYKKYIEHLNRIFIVRYMNQSSF